MRQVFDALLLDDNAIIAVRPTSLLGLSLVSDFQSFVYRFVALRGDKTIHN